MGWSRHDEDARADHYRDSMKHLDNRPGERDYVPLSAEPKPMTTAMEIAVLARVMKNTTEVAALIDQYADMVAKCALADEAEQRVKEMQQ